MTVPSGILRITCVWALLPLTFVSGLPQLRCLCAEAQGKRFCECCFAATEQNAPESLPPCCREHRAKASKAGSSEHSACPVCGAVHATPRSGCFYLKVGAARLVSPHVDVQDHLVIQAVALVSPAPLATVVVGQRHAVEPAASLPPPDDLVTMLGHLLI
jgi:hypothetical protein